MALSPAQIPTLIRNEEIIIYNTVAASALVFWDHILTFREEEIDLIWRSKFSVVDLLFFVIRYVILSIRIFQLVVYTNVLGVLHPTIAMCKAWVWFEAIPGHVVFLSVEVVLAMRVIAFYGNARYARVGVVAAFAAAHAASATILLLSIPKFVVAPNPLPPRLHVSACLVTHAPSIFINYWIPGLVLESVLFLLLIARFVYTNHGHASRPHVLIIFVRDGAWAFLVIFGVFLWAALAFQFSPAKGDTALTWVLSILGVCGSRLILNLRAAAHTLHDFETQHLELHSLHTLRSLRPAAVPRTRTRPPPPPLPKMYKTEIQSYYR